MGPYGLGLERRSVALDRCTGSSRLLGAPGPRVGRGTSVRQRTRAFFTVVVVSVVSVGCTSGVATSTPWSRAPASRSRWWRWNRSSAPCSSRARARLPLGLQGRLRGSVARAARQQRRQWERWRWQWYARCDSGWPSRQQSSDKQPWQPQRRFEFKQRRRRSAGSLAIHARPGRRSSESDSASGTAFPCTCQRNCGRRT